MSSPYLESGESIVLTTDRVGLDQTVYTAMLTNRQLILLDSEHGLHEPWTIALATVLSVRSGNAATGEPVISITCERPDGKETTTCILHFLQGPLENRKHDRDLWVKKIIEHSLSGRAVEGEGEEPLPSARADHPVLKRKDGPEIIRPKIENFPQPEPSPDAAVTLDETEHLVQPEVPATGLEPVETAGVPGPVWPVLGLAKNDDEETGQPDGAASEPAGQASEEKPPCSHAPQDRDDDGRGGSLTVAILRAVQSLTQKPLSRNGEKGIGTPEETDEPQERPIRRTSSLPENPAESRRTAIVAKKPPAPSDTTPQGTTPDRSTASEEISDEPTPEVFPGMPIDDVRTAIEETAALPEPAQEPPTPAALAGNNEESAATERPTTEKNIGHRGDKPAGRSPKTTWAGRDPVLTVAIIVLLLLGIAAVLVLPALQLPEPPARTIDTPTPVTTITPTPVPMETAPPRPTSIETPAPSPTPEVTPVPPALVQSTVPQTGVWVRVASPAAYSGQAGNPGYLRQFNGPGEKFISTYRPEGLVQVSVQKHDYSDAELLVEIFNNGALVISRSTTAPMGSVDLLIDPKTGSPPGLPPVTTTTTTTASPHAGYV